MKKYLGIIIVILYAAVCVIDLLHPGFAVTHDGQDHIARIANFFLNLQQGILIPRWAENLNFGYGHPILEFLYPLPSYIASFFHLLGFSFIDSTKLVFAISMVASGLSMYLFVKKIWGNIPGVVSGILYMYAPYRFVDLYVRGDIGEHVAFVFIPLCFLGFLLVSQKQTFFRFVFSSISIACLVLSHNAIALMYMPILLLYALFLFWENEKKRKIGISLLLGVIFGLLLSGFFWIPALFEGQYTLRNIVTKGEYASRFVSLGQLFYGKWNYGISGMFTVQLGIIHWACLAFAFVLEVWNGKKLGIEKYFMRIIFLSTLISIFLMLPISGFVWSRVILLQNFQFPWRFLAICVFTTSVCGGFVVAQLRGQWRIVATVAVCSLILFLSKDYIHARSYKSFPESFFTGIYSTTTDTGESTPIWSVRGMPHKPSQQMQVIQGKASITNISRVTTRHIYSVSAGDNTKVVDNTLYFPGWQVQVDETLKNIEFQDINYRGLITFSVPQGVHTVVVSYHESRLRFLGDLIAFFGAFDLVVIYYLYRKKYL